MVNSRPLQGQGHSFSILLVSNEIKAFTGIMQVHGHLNVKVTSRLKSFQIVSV